ncbi:MAG: hypothetical protein H0V79_12360, partial [Actinobacteria bacterium]|nr:hypothetical protein [Actinomycetota bacterium]
MKAILAGLAFLVLTLPGSGLGAGEPVLVGTVGPGFTITLKDSGGNDVTSIPPGTYDMEIRDESEFHNFRLTGPGVSHSTTVTFVGTVVWEDVALGAGSTYTFDCEPHSGSMRGSFTTTATAPPPPAPPPPPPPPSPPPPPPPLPPPPPP